MHKKKKLKKTCNFVNWNISENSKHPLHVLTMKWKYKKGVLKNIFRIFWAIRKKKKPTIPLPNEKWTRVFTHFAAKLSYHMIDVVLSGCVIKLVGTYRSSKHVNRIQTSNYSSTVITGDFFIG